MSDFILKTSIKTQMINEDHHYVMLYNDTRQHVELSYIPSAPGVRRKVESVNFLCRHL